MRLISTFCGYHGGYLLCGPVWCLCVSRDYMDAETCVRGHVDTCVFVERVGAERMSFSLHATIRTLHRIVKLILWTENKLIGYSFILID